MPTPNTTPVPLGPREAALGQRFVDIRRAHKVWLRPLAKQLGISVNTLRWHVAGARLLRLDVLDKAATIIGVPLAILVDLDGVTDYTSYQAAYQASLANTKEPE